jgi:hypothetical protein
MLVSSSRPALLNSAQMSGRGRFAAQLRHFLLQFGGEVRALDANNKNNEVCSGTILQRSSPGLGKGV